MGVKLFSKKIYESEIKKNKSFIVVITATIVFMYNIINTYYNETIYPKVQEFVKMRYEDVDRNWITIDYPSIGIMKTSVFFILIVATAVVVLCTFKYIKEKSENIACIMYSGGSYKDALEFLVYTNFKSFSISTILGVLIGIVISPLSNIIMYKLVQKEGSLFTFNLEGIINVFLIIGLQYAIILTINFGYIYRKDVMGLITIKGAKTVDDKRIVKIPYIIYVILYFLPVLYIMTFPNYEDAGDTCLGLSILSAAVLFWFIKYGLDGIYKSLKKRKFMYKSTRILYISNAIKTIKESYAYIFILMIVMINLTSTMMEMIEFTGMKEIMLLSIAGSSIVISLAIGYKFTVEAREIEFRAKQMRLLGFSNKSIRNCIAKEIILTFTLTTTIPLIVLASNIYMYTISGALSTVFGVSLILSILIPSNVIGFICSSICTNKVNNNLKAHNKKLEKEELVDITA